MADQWEPIRIYSYLGESRPDLSVTRERVVSYLNGTDPDSIERAGKSYVEAAKLIKGEGGVQGALMKAAKDLSEVWRGDGAKQALKALRLLHASAGALGEAMQKTGEPMQKYAERVRHYRSTVPAPAGNPEENSGGGMTNGGPGGEPSGETAPPVIDSSGGGSGGGSGRMGYAPLDADADERARKHLESLNNEIADINARIADGLAFEMPTINPLTVDTQPANKLTAPTATDLSNGNGDGRWNGGTSDPDVTTGSGDKTGSGSTGNGSDGTGNGSDGSDGTGKDDGDEGDGTTQPQDPGGQGQDDPSTGDDPATQQPGTETPQQDQPGDQDQEQDQQDVPPVITAEDSGTDLAQTTTQPPPTTTTPNPYATPNPYTSTPPGVLPTTQPPGGTPFTGGGPTAGGPWYGAGGPAATSPAVLRGGGAPGNGFMAFPPGAMGAGAQDHCDEHTREYYDSEPDIWSPPVPTSPEKLC